jgi:hypothetical protein
MADDDIAARGFCSYSGALERLVDDLGWRAERAGPAFLDAVNQGRIRRQRHPNPPSPPYDTNKWNPKGWGHIAVPFDTRPPFATDQFSVTDLDKFITEERAEPARSAPASPETTTKQTLPVPELIAQMRRRSEQGRLAPKWDIEARDLSNWSEGAHPARPHAYNSIRGHATLKAEWKRLTGRSS